MQFRNAVIALYAAAVAQAAPYVWKSNKSLPKEANNYLQSHH
jgi:hypothetical protein